MDKKQETTDFDKALDRAERHMSELNKVYKSTIGLVNDIKNRSKKYMEQVSDVEEGLFESAESSEALINENVSKLTQNIQRFNEEVGEHCDQFNKEITAMVEAMNHAFELYQKGKGSLTELLKARRLLLYLDALIRKFKTKIVSLQLMNNALFAFSQEMKHIKEGYKSNLVNVNTEMTEAVEHCDKMIQKIEDLEG